MSYSVVIVEDEQIVREDLESSTPWEKLGLELAASCADGLEGEAQIRLLNPDIVITDIRLPGQDGIKMLERCQPPHAVILSGYTDFSYTRSAIKLGVFDYLEKPVDPAELEATLSELVVRIRQEDQDIVSLSARVNRSSRYELIELPRSVDNHIINSVIGYIAANYSRPVGLQEAAEYLSISESHLSRLFKEETGLNFLQYLNAWRINKAIQLMSDPRRNISEIAGECGFPSPGYFAKIFKRFSGKTPSQYRDNISQLLNEESATDGSFA